VIGEKIMKKILLIVLPLLLIVGCSKEPINYEETLNYRDGVYYTKDTNQPYSGPVFSLDGNGRNKRESILEDGKMITYIDFRWYENGQKKEETTYKDGKPDGLYTGWWKNGQKKYEVTFKDGKLISEKEWNEDGSVKE
tara:strand:- start:37 stop:450 length:414 start_codon:yes stop_codon:yes gene_type:complete